MDQVDFAQRDFVEAAPRFTLYQTPPRGLAKLANSPPSSPSSGRKLGLFANESFSRHSPVRGPVTSMSQLSPNKKLQFTPIIYRGASEMHRVVYDDSDEEEGEENSCRAWGAKMPIQHSEAWAASAASVEQPSSNHFCAENSYFGPSSMPFAKALESHPSTPATFHMEDKECHARQWGTLPSSDGVSPSGSSDDILEVSSPPLDSEATLNEKNGGISSVSTSHEEEDSAWGDEVAAAFGSEDANAGEPCEDANEDEIHNLRSGNRAYSSAIAFDEREKNAVEVVQKTPLRDECPVVDAPHKPLAQAVNLVEECSLKAEPMKSGSNKSAAIALSDHDEKAAEDIHEKVQYAETEPHVEQSLTPKPDMSQSQHERVATGKDEVKAAAPVVRPAWEEIARRVEPIACAGAVEAPESVSGAETPPPPRLLSSKTQLGDEWRAATDGRGRRYYYNRRTRETTWVAPPHLVKVETPEGGFRLYTLTQENQPSLASPSKPPLALETKLQGHQGKKSLPSTPLRTRTTPQRTLRGLREALRGTNRRAATSATPQRAPPLSTNATESASNSLGHCPGCAGHVDLLSHLPLCEASRRLKGTVAARALGKFFASDVDEVASPAQQQPSPQRSGPERTPAKSRSSSPSSGASKTQPLVTPMRRQTRPPRAPQPAEAAHGKLLWSPPPRKALSGRTVLRGGSQATALYIP